MPHAGSLEAKRKKRKRWLLLLLLLLLLPGGAGWYLIVQRPHGKTIVQTVSTDTLSSAHAVFPAERKGDTGQKETTEKQPDKQEAVSGNEPKATVAEAKKVGHFEPIVQWRARMDLSASPPEVYQAEYEKFKEVDHPEALARLGYLYREGKGVEKDRKKALKLFRKAAAQENAFGQYNLGYFYSQGYELARNYKEARTLYRKAAEKGDANGQSNFGHLYDKALGVTEDNQKAVYWYRKAAEQGYANGQYNLGVKYEKGEGIARDYKKAVYWYRKAAEQAYAPALSNLGHMYLNGFGVLKDYQKAFYWLNKAVKQDEPHGQYNLGFMYDQGYGLEVADWSEAFRWYQKAAAQGHPEAQRKLGEFYCFGVGGARRSKAKAIAWFRKAAKGGDAKAEVYLQVLKDMDAFQGKSFVTKKNSFGDELKVSYSFRKPLVSNKITSSWSEQVRYRLAKATQIRLSSSAQLLTGKKPGDELLFNRYSSMELARESGQQKLSAYFEKPVRSIGYLYILAELDSENIVIKLPMALCQAPASEK